MSVPIPDARERALLERLARPAADAPLRVLCSGIGGTGVSGLARILHGLGHTVRGSDRAPSPRCARLEKAGIPITTAQRAENVGPDVDLVVATAALAADHPERVAARERGVPVVKYARALGAVVATRRGVAIAGTHGKTTTTSLTTYVLRQVGVDPSWIVGGDPKDLPANAHLAGGDALVFEACEYDRSFRHYAPEVAVILNVEEDHLDCYPEGMPAILDAFAAFAAQLRPGGTLVASADCPGVAEVVRRTRAARPDVAVLTFSLTDRRADLAAAGLHEADGLPTFELTSGGQPCGTVRLAVPGRHNAVNALAAVAVAVALGVPAGDAARAVGSFRGVGRRFDVLRRGDVTVVEDYAHHPTAIAAVIAAARGRYPDRRVVVCFEPHQASRTRDLYGDFVAALAGADRVLISDIYLCRDTAESAAAVSAERLAHDVATAAPQTEARHAGDLDAVGREALEQAAAGDVFLFLGAGRIGQIAHRVAERLGGRRALAPAVGGDLDDRVARTLGDRVRCDVPLGPHCSYRTGGTSRFFVAPRDEEEAIETFRALRRFGVPVIPLGGGSNTLFAGHRLDAAVLHTRRMRAARVLGRTVRASAGASLPGLIRLAERHGLGGLERLAGIPGTLGGAVFGNAGGPPGAVAIGDRVARVRVVEADGAVRWRSREELGIRYRGSDLSGALVVGIDLELEPADRAELRRVRLAASERKRSVQPLDAFSAGCVFRNPPGQSAGRLIDELGLKGLRRGGASVSTVHANFIVNDGDATPDDVIGLVEDVRQRVLVATGVRLHTELRLVA